MKQRFHWAGSAYLLLAAAERLGVAKTDVLNRAGIAPEELPPSPGRIAWELLAPLVESVLELTQEPGIGLMAGWMGKVHHHGIAGAYYMQVSPYRASQQYTYDQVWSRLSNLMRFWHEDAGDRLLAHGELIAPEEPLMEPLLHLWLRMHVATYRGLFGRDVGVGPVAIRSTTAGEARHLSELSLCEVVTGQPGNWVSAPRELAERRMPLADPWMREQLKPQMDAFLASLDEEKNATVLVRDALETALAGGESIDLPAIAARLNWKPRTLRARLAAERTSFSDVLASERKRRVLDLLRFPNAKLSAVAAQAGFSDPAAFTRAFRRWMGTTPMQWRRSMEGLFAPGVQAAREAV